MLLIPIVGLHQDVRHAPTLESCAADINLWTSEIPGLRISALDRCTESHPSLAKALPGEEAPAELLVALYNGEMKQRLMDFLDRHGLGAKFIEEDKEGKR
jgi:hypothetical protein